METQLASPRPKNRPLRRILGVAALFAAGLGAGFGLGKLLKSQIFLDALLPQTSAEAILYGMMLLFVLWLVIALHELGHLLAGLAQGFRLALYTAGLLGVRGTKNGVKVFFNRDYNSMGGLAATFPESVVSGPKLRRQFARIVAAGPLSSLALAVLAFSAGWWLLPGLSTGASLAARIGVFFLLFTGFSSFLIFLATTLPGRSKGFSSDRARFFSLLDTGDKGLLEEAGLSTMALMGAGKLPGEYPPELIRRLQTQPGDNMIGLNGHYTAFMFHLDRGETAEAEALAVFIADNVQQVPVPVVRRYFLKDLVFFYAFIKKDAAKAAELWAEIEKNALRDKDSATFRSRAALALANGKLEEAEQFAQQGLDKLSEVPFEGQRLFEEKWLGALLNELNHLQHAV